MESRRHPWGWSWWLLALVLLAAGVFVGHRVIGWRQQQPAVQPVEFSLSESYADTASGSRHAPITGFDATGVCKLSAPRHDRPRAAPHFLLP
jgi:hypothetical protein